jgi:hypothetical protein
VLSGVKRESPHRSRHAVPLKVSCESVCELVKGDGPHQGNRKENEGQGRGAQDVQHVAAILGRTCGYEETIKPEPNI